MGCLGKGMLPPPQGQVPRGLEGKAGPQTAILRGHLCVHPQGPGLYPLLPEWTRWQLRTAHSTQSAQKEAWGVGSKGS